MASLEAKCTVCKKRISVEWKSTPKTNKTAMKKAEDALFGALDTCDHVKPEEPQKV